MSTNETAALEECLHCDIMQVIGDHMEVRTASGREVNLPDMTDCIVDSLAQFILEAAPAEERVAIISYALERFGQALRADQTARRRHLN